MNKFEETLDSLIGKTIESIEIVESDNDEEYGDVIVFEATDGTTINLTIDREDSDFILLENFDID